MDLLISCNRRRKLDTVFFSDRSTVSVSEYDMSFVHSDISEKDNPEYTFLFNSWVSSFLDIAEFLNQAYCLKVIKLSSWSTKKVFCSKLFSAMGVFDPMYPLIVKEIFDYPSTLGIHPLREEFLTHAERFCANKDVCDFFRSKIFDGEMKAKAIHYWDKMHKNGFRLYFPMERCAR
jgi:hypothetical protein